MKISKKILSFLILIIVLFLSHLCSYIIGEWLVKGYAGPGWFIIGPFQGYVDGFIISYIFLSSLFFGWFLGGIRYGFYFALPALFLIIISSSFNPQLFVGMTALLLGLLIAYILLSIRKKMHG